MKHERDEIARNPLPSPRYDSQGYLRKDGHLLLHWVKPQPVTETPPPSIVFETVHLVRRYLHSGECIWYEPTDNNR